MRLHWLILPASLALAVTAQAGSVTIGSYDSGNCYPFMCNDSGTSSGQSIDYQQVYTSSAFTSGPITINSETFYYASQLGGNEAVLNGDYSVYLSTTSKSVSGLSSTLSSNRGSDWTLVFSGMLGGPYTNSFTITDTTGFHYDPSKGNLLLEVIASNQQNVPEKNKSMYGKYAPNGSGNGYNEADYTGIVTQRAYCLTNIGCTGSTTGALVTTFSYGGTGVPEPASLFLVGAGLLGLGFASKKLRKS
jgi:hypothetical protein